MMCLYLTARKVDFLSKLSSVVNYNLITRKNLYLTEEMHINEVVDDDLTRFGRRPKPPKIN